MNAEYVSVISGVPIRFVMKSVIKCYDSAIQKISEHLNVWSLCMDYFVESKVFSIPSGFGYC